MTSAGGQRNSIRTKAKPARPLGVWLPDTSAILVPLVSETVPLTVPLFWKSRQKTKSCFVHLDPCLVGNVSSVKVHSTCGLTHAMAISPNFIYVGSKRLSLVVNSIERACSTRSPCSCRLE